MCPKEPVAFVLGVCDPDEYLLKAYGLPVLYVDPDRFQGLRYEGKCEVACCGRRQATQVGWQFNGSALLPGTFGGGSVVDFVLHRKAPCLEQVIPGLIAFTLIQVPAVVAAEVAGARPSRRRVDLVAAARSLARPAESAQTGLRDRQ
jgi:hypothetical protein